MGAAKACIVVGVICLLLGVVFILAGTLGIGYEVPKQKLDYLIIDSKDNAQYSDWAGGYDKKVEYDMVFYFFNLTNPNEVRQNGAVPIYTNVGPYVYRRYRTAINVSFPEDGKQIKFVDWREYQYNEEASGGRNRFDYIVNLNPVFLSALQQAGSELQMLAGAAGGYFPNFTTYFTGEFVSLYTSYVLPEYWPNVYDNQIKVINETLNSTEKSVEYFLATWANGTVENENKIGDWTGLLLSQHFGTPTGISQESAIKLLDPSFPFSLLNTSNITAWAWDRSLFNFSYTELLLNTFDINVHQLEAIWYWRVKTFGPAFIYPHVIQKYNLTNITDIGWVQWTAGYDVLGGSVESPISIHDKYPTEEIGYYCTVELFLAPSDPPTFPDWQTTSFVLNPKTGLGNMTVFQDYALTMSNQNPNASYTKWGMTNDQAEQMYTYIVTAGYMQVLPALLAVFGDSGGLILNQTVEDWVFNCNYFLINLLLPVPQSCSLLENNTVFNTATIWSGKGNISRINEYYEWDGSPVVSGVWAKDIPVVGCTELGQFRPDQSNSTVLQTFNDEFVRTMTLRFNSTSSVRNISTNQFVLDYKDIFAVNPLYYQSIPGFSNMTTFKQAPVFYSLWDMLYVNETIRKMVVGLSDNTTEADCSTSVDVEPITGNTLRASKKLQVNMYIPPGSDSWCINSFSFFSNFNITQNTFFPLVKAGESTEITESLADEVRKKLALLDELPHYGLIIGLSVGIFVLVLGVLMIIFGKRRVDYEYSRINESSMPTRF